MRIFTGFVRLHCSRLCELGIRGYITSIVLVSMELMRSRGLRIPGVMAVSNRVASPRGGLQANPALTAGCFPKRLTQLVRVRSPPTEAVATGSVFEAAAHPHRKQPVAAEGSTT